MIIGVPKEIKADEYRVAMIPAGVELLVHAGHSVLIESQAGVGSGLSDDEYTAAGATIVSSAWRKCGTARGDGGEKVKKSRSRRNLG